MRYSSGFYAALIAPPLLVALAGLAACEKKEEAAAPPPPPPAVIVAKVVRSEVTPSFTFTGRIEAIDKVDLRARVEGFIEKQSLPGGRRVKPGELMFVMEKAAIRRRRPDPGASFRAERQAQLKLADIETEPHRPELVAKKVKAQQELDIAIAKQGGAKRQCRAPGRPVAASQFGPRIYTDIITPLPARVGRAVFLGRRLRRPVERRAHHRGPARIRSGSPSRSPRASCWRCARQCRGCGRRPAQCKRSAPGWPTARSILSMRARSIFSASRSTRRPTPSPCAPRCPIQKVISSTASWSRRSSRRPSPRRCWWSPYQAMQIDQSGRFVLTFDGEQGQGAAHRDRPDLRTISS